MAVIDLTPQLPPSLQRILRGGRPGGGEGGGRRGGGGGGGGGRVVWGVAALVVLGFVAYTASYTCPAIRSVWCSALQACQRGQPGLHFKIPLGVDSVIIVPVKRQLKQEFGFSTDGATNYDQGRSDTVQQSQMVTGDLNAALVGGWSVSDLEPRKYLFDVRNPGDTLRDGVRIGDARGRRRPHRRRSADDRAPGDRGRGPCQDARSRPEVRDRGQHRPGATEEHQPATAGAESFNEVNQAQQEKERLINEARRDYNKVIPLAEGEKDQRIREADGYRLKRGNEAEGDAARFNAVFQEYLKAPEVTRRRIYIETLQEVLPALESKIIVDESVRQILPLMHLNPAQADTGAKR
ncbi:MAG: protease modulator HflK [Burkholderiaceae bacterium]